VSTPPFDPALLTPEVFNEALQLVFPGSSGFWNSTMVWQEVMEMVFQGAGLEERNFLMARAEGMDHCSYRPECLVIGWAGHFLSRHAWCWTPGMAAFCGVMSTSERARWESPEAWKWMGDERRDALRRTLPDAPLVWHVSSITPPPLPPGYPSPCSRALAESILHALPAGLAKVETRVLENILPLPLGPAPRSRL
jgi:hypothetical protein